MGDRGRIAICITILLGASAFARGQGTWTAIRLHDPGLAESVGLAGNGSVQGGYLVRQGGFIEEPAIWAGSSGSWVSLAPAPGAATGRVNAVWGAAQGGEWSARASLWSGTASSIVDLHPGGFVRSAVLAMRGGQQAGYSTVGPGFGMQRAALWTGTAGSFVNLHPASAAQSTAQATDGARQGGAIDTGAGFWHAALWSGSAASVLDLNPGPQYTSGITCMVPGQQGGRISLGLPSHAAIWSGTPESVVDLHPFPGSGSSLILSTTGTVQAGQSHVPGGGFPHAGVWFGTASSFVDLHQYLPAGYYTSGAGAVWQEGDTLYVTGAAANSALPEAWMWIGTVPAPGASALVLGAMGLLARRRRPPNGTAPTASVGSRTRR